MAASASAGDETWFGKSFPSCEVSKERLRGEGSVTGPLAKGQKTEHKIIDLTILKESVRLVVPLVEGWQRPLMDGKCQ